MSRDVVALVSADDFISAVRVYADRVNDLLRRGGVPALEAIEIAETHALALLDAVVNAPETVIDLAGWWFARAIELTSQAGVDGGDVVPDQPASMLAGTLGEEEVRGALEALPEAERAAVILRDGYDLPAAAVGVALRRGIGSAIELTTAGRLHLVTAYDNRRVPDLSGHSGRVTVDLVSLSLLADGTLDSARAAPLRRHATSCTACEDVLESLAKGRRLAAGLPIIAMDDDAREALISRMSSRAEAVLPTHEEVLRAVDEDHDPGPAVHPMLAVIALVLAVVLGVGIAMIHHADSGSAATPTTLPTIQPPETQLFTTPTAHVPKRFRQTATATPTISATVSPTPTHTRTRSATPTDEPSTDSPPPSNSTAAIALSPSRGPANTTITISGSGFKPGSTVRLSYAARAGTTAVADDNGEFTAVLHANALLPGAKTVTAQVGGRSASATFTDRRCRAR